jgi:hypothetical protein
MTGTPARIGGNVLAGLVAAVRLVRRPRPLHPHGVALTGTLTPGAGRVASGLAWLDGLDAPLDVDARFSRGGGLPPALPDVLGLALRIPGDDGATVDVLLASTGLSPVGRFLLAPRRALSGARDRGAGAPRRAGGRGSAAAGRRRRPRTHARDARRPDTARARDAGRAVARSGADRADARRRRPARHGDARRSGARGPARGHHVPVDAPAARAGLPGGAAWPTGGIPACRPRSRLLTRTAPTPYSLARVASRDGRPAPPVSVRRSPCGSRSASPRRRGRRVPAGRVPRGRQRPQRDERRSGNPTVYPPEIAQLRQSSAGPCPPLST